MNDRSRVPEPALLQLLIEHTHELHQRIITLLKGTRYDKCHHHRHRRNQLIQMNQNTPTHQHLLISAQVHQQISQLHDRPLNLYPFFERDFDGVINSRLISMDQELEMSKW